MNSIPEIVKQLRESHINEAEKSDIESIKKDMQSNSTYKKAKSIVEKYGYEIDPYCFVDVRKGNKFIKFNVEGNERFDPEIHFQRKSWGEDGYEFKIQTTSYGSLTIEEYATFLVRVTAAYNMVKELDKLDLFTLYEYQREE